MSDTPNPKVKWYVSNYLDDGRFGIVDHNNFIIHRLREGLTREKAQQIVDEHNREVGAS